MKQNKIYAVKRHNEFWAVIDCGEKKEGGMTTGNYWLTHFEKDGIVYRWINKLFQPPSRLKDWDEINIIEKTVTIVSEGTGNIFEGWDDVENGCYETLSNFSKLIGKPLTINEVRQLINP